MAALGYLLVRYVGNEEGMVKPDTAWGWFTGIVSGTLIMFYFEKKE